MPDQFLGERSCVFIIPRDEAPKAAELKAFLRERGLAAYKIPDRVEFVESFPQTGVGKVSKKRSVKPFPIYHEMVAHVPLFTHPNPEHVLVVGGGDGGVIREILKHPSVKKRHL